MQSSNHQVAVCVTEPLPLRLLETGAKTCEHIVVLGLFPDITIYFTEITSIKLLKFEWHIVQSHCTYFANICSYILQHMMDTSYLWSDCICMLWTLKLLKYSYIYVNIRNVFGKTTIFGAATLRVCTSMDCLGSNMGLAALLSFSASVCYYVQHTMAVKLGTNRIANVCFLRIILWPGFINYIKIIIWTGQLCLWRWE